MASQASIRKAASATSFWGQSQRMAAVCLALAALTFAVFGQTARFQFVNYDDKSYIYDNAMVQKGLTLEGFRWAWTYGKIGHWHPVTWLSHMADCQLYGLWAGGHHLTSVALHALAVVLLFLAVKEMTGNFWRSAFVAAVFGIHPLRAESVAWVAERKDVLSGLFFCGTLLAYARYVKLLSPGRYAAVVLAFALGLLCKNMLVTLPFVLLLLDWWPLRRAKPFLQLWREKIPLFALSVASCVATALVPEQVMDFAKVPFFERAGNALVSYVIYLRQMLLPTGLAIPYLYPPNGLPNWEIAAALVLLAAITVIVFGQRNQRPYLLMGWLWFVGMLVPAIGLIQFSYYSHADRYTYLPGIGLILAVTWLTAELGRPSAVLATAALVALLIGAWRQTAHWKDSETLWTHTLACTSGNYIARYNLGLALAKQGRTDEAIEQYQEAVKMNPGYADTYVNLGIALFQTGRPDEGIAQLRQALSIKPNFAAAHNNLGNALMQKGGLDEAITHFQTALQIDPHYASAEDNLGNALLRKGKVTEAIVHFQQALKIDPADAATENNLAWLLATSSDASVRDGRQAVELAERANAQMRGANPFFLSTLAASYAETGRFPEAIEAAQRGLLLAQAQSRTRLAGSLETELKLYQAGSPFHSP